MLGQDHRLTRAARAARAVTGAVLAAALLAACGSTSGPTPPTPSAPPSSAPAPTPTHAAAAPVPQSGTCHALTYQQAEATTAPATSVACSHAHTSQTFSVGRLDDVVDGHLLAVDSDRVQRQVARSCPARLATYVGGAPGALRLTMLRAVWFTPSLVQAAAGARWYRCDAIVVDGASSLAALTTPLKGVLDSSRAGDYAMCGTAKPGTSGFERVPCSAPHTWKALSVVPLPAGAYPGVPAVQSAGTEPCRKAAANVAPNALDYQWGYDWPSAAQWAAGQTYGICWAPSS